MSGFISANEEHRRIAQKGFSARRGHLISQMIRANKLRSRTGVAGGAHQSQVEVSEFSTPTCRDLIGAEVALGCVIYLALSGIGL